MNEFSKLRKLQRVKAVEAGVVKRVSVATNKHKGSVSRTLAGITKVPDPAVVAALRLELRKLGIEVNGL